MYQVWHSGNWLFSAFCVPSTKYKVFDYASREIRLIHFETNLLYGRYIVPGTWYFIQIHISYFVLGTWYLVHKKHVFPPIVYLLAFSIHSGASSMC
jgi:hypothetical protein